MADTQTPKKKRKTTTSSYVNDVETRRHIVIRALKGENKNALCREYGITRNAIYNMLKVALTSPKKKLAEAEREVEFRREVYRLSR